jgi:hypothetical protein
VNTRFQFQGSIGFPLQVIIQRWPYLILLYHLVVVVTLRLLLTCEVPGSSLELKTCYSGKSVVLAAMIMKSTILWDITPCSPLKLY